MPRSAPNREKPMSRANQSGRPAARAPKAAHEAPTTLYRANSAVLALPCAALARRECSSGRNTLTSPELGLSVPTKATTSKGQNDDRLAKPRPVAAISAAAPRNRRLAANRWPQAPTASVANADPSIVAVLTMPTCKVPMPIASRYAGSSTAM
jgi:hypothetical protein